MQACCSNRDCVASSSNTQNDNQNDPKAVDGTQSSTTGKTQSKLVDTHQHQRASTTTVAKKLHHKANVPLNLLNKQLLMRVANMPAHVATSYRMRTIAQHIAGCLQRYGWAVVDNFLGEPQSLSLQEETLKLYYEKDRSQFVEGQLVKSSSTAQSQLIRSDKILWWDASADGDHSYIGFMLSVIDSVIYSCAPQLAPYKIQGRSRAMIACYPGNGSHYVTHVDNPDRDGRCITSIYYLNRNWEPSHGGELRLYPESATEPVDIQPIFDRLMFFWSDRRNPHEVLPVHKDRFAITVWYFDTEEKANYVANDPSLPVKAKHVIDKVLKWDSALPPPPPLAPTSPSPPVFPMSHPLSDKYRSTSPPVNTSDVSNMEHSLDKNKKLTQNNLEQFTNMSIGVISSVSSTTSKTVENDSVLESIIWRQKRTLSECTEAINGCDAYKKKCSEVESISST